MQEVWRKVGPSTPRALNLLSWVKKKTEAHELSVKIELVFSAFMTFCFLGTPSSRGVEVVERKTPQEVLHEQNDQMCQEVEKVIKK